jgi:hypothetical protein
VPRIADGAIAFHRTIQAAAIGGGTRTSTNAGVTPVIASHLLFAISAQAVLAARC